MSIQKGIIYFLYEPLFPEEKIDLYAGMCPLAKKRITAGHSVHVSWDSGLIQKNAKYQWFKRHYIELDKHDES